MKIRGPPEGIGVIVDAENNSIYLAVSRVSEIEGIKPAELGLKLFAAGIELKSREFLMQEQRKWNESAAEVFLKFSSEETEKIKSTILHRYDRRQMRRVVQESICCRLEGV